MKPVEPVVAALWLNMHFEYWKLKQVGVNAYRGTWFALSFAFICE
jgi:hypothetical protein